MRYSVCLANFRYRASQMMTLYAWLLASHDTGELSDDYYSEYDTDPSVRVNVSAATGAKPVAKERVSEYVNDFAGNTEEVQVTFNLTDKGTIIIHRS